MTDATARPQRIGLNAPCVRYRTETADVPPHSIGMPRFFFRTRQDDGLIEDPDGIELPDLEAARAEAARSVREIVAERLKAGQTADFRQVEICDDTGQVLA